MNHFWLFLLFWQISLKLRDEKEVIEEIRLIADGPSEDVHTFNGYKMDEIAYNKYCDDTRHVQCSGVCVQANTIVVQGKNQNIEHPPNTFYGVITSASMCARVAGRTIKFFFLYYGKNFIFIC